MSHIYPGHGAVLDYLREAGPSTTFEVAKALGMTTNVARSRLQNLVAAGEVSVANRQWTAVSSGGPRTRINNHPVVKRTVTYGPWEDA